MRQTSQIDGVADVIPFGIPARLSLNMMDLAADLSGAVLNQLLGVSMNTDTNLDARVGIPDR